MQQRTAAAVPRTTSASALTAPVAEAAAAPPALSNADIAKKLFDATLAPNGKHTMQQINALAETVLVYNGPAGIHSAALLGNAASDATSYPSGLVINFRADARVNPLTLSPDAMHYLVLCAVVPGKEQKLDDAYFESKLADLAAAVPQFSSAPIAMTVRDEIRNVDEALWTEELGPSGSAGVLKCKDKTKTDYLIMANCTAPKLGQDFIDGLVELSKEGKAPTWDEMVASKEFIYWREGVRRQACRIAFAVAEKLKVSIQTVGEDATYMQSEDQAKRRTALPMHAQWISCIDRSSPIGSRMRSTVSQYSKCAAVVQRSEQVGYHVVSISPFEGFHGIKLSSDFRPTRNALPCTTGRATAPNAANAPLKKEDAERIATKFTWEGKGPSAPINDRVHPAAYRPFDEEFLQKNFVSQGWTSLGKRAVEDLDVVILKIAPRKARTPQ